MRSCEEIDDRVTYWLLINAYIVLQAGQSCGAQLTAITCIPVQCALIHFTTWVGNWVRTYPTPDVCDALQAVAGLPGRQRLRSSSTSALALPLTRLSTIGDRAFPIAAEKTWSFLLFSIAGCKVTGAIGIFNFKFYHIIVLYMKSN